MVQLYVHKLQERDCQVWLRPTLYTYTGTQKTDTRLRGVTMRSTCQGPWVKPWSFLDVGRADSTGPGLVEPGSQNIASGWQEAGTGSLV